jgi:hypothetical protein
VTTLAELTERYLDAERRGNAGLIARLGAELDKTGQDAEDRLAKPGALLSAALWYARRGVAVFPCMPRDKRPVTEHGFKNATTDEAKIRAWWHDRPDLNIGAPTGRTFDVIDVDGREGVLAVYGPAGDGKRPIDDVDEIGHALTPRDAGHHIFIAPTGRGNTANMLPGVDYRGAGGYVLLAPSVGSNGRRYRWTRPLHKA